MRNLIILLLILVFIANSHANPIEIKGIKTQCDQEEGVILYTLPEACLVRQYIKINEGPIVRLGDWSLKEKGYHRDTLLPSEGNSERLIHKITAYKILEDENPDAKIRGLEQDLRVEISVIKPRLGQYTHDYQKNAKKIKIDINGNKNGLYTLICAIDYGTCLIEKNVNLPYIWEKDFGYLAKGDHNVSIEIRGGDRAVGIGSVEIKVI